MSIQNKYDLVLLGNLIIDEIYCIDGWPKQGTSNDFQSYKTSIGGIGNIIKEISNKLKISTETIIHNDDREFIGKYLIEQNTVNDLLQCSHNPTSKALIISNLEKSERTSFVNWGCAYDHIIPADRPSKWTHISYLDTSNIDIQSINNTDIFSADLCLSNPTKEQCLFTIEQCKYLDYLFASEAELYPLIGFIPNIDQIINFVIEAQIACLIFHTKYKTLVIKNNICVEISNPSKFIEGANVLGAGDVYCANFIYDQISNGSSIEQSIMYAHNQANKFVLLNE